MRKEKEKGGENAKALAELRGASRRNHQNDLTIRKRTTSASLFSKKSKDRTTPTRSMKRDSKETTPGPGIGGRRL